MRYLANISYDGSKFQGFQRLNNGCGVQNELERVLKTITKEDVLVKGSGRTDAGVHAYHQYVHFDLHFTISISKLKYAMNRLLSSYISVNSLRVVKDDFHARFFVKSKTYLYKVYIGEKNPFLADYTYPFYQKVSLKQMKRCAKLFLGTHDFRNFISGKRQDYMTTIFSFQIKKEKDYILFTVNGKSFYHYMVRSLVGALLDVGEGKRTLEEVKLALDKPLQKRTFSVLPANGLYLVDVFYDKL